MRGARRAVVLARDPSLPVGQRRAFQARGGEITFMPARSVVDLPVETDQFTVT